MRGRRRREYEEALSRMRGWAQASAGPDWTEEQWRGILRRATRQSLEPPPPRRTPLWRPALAAVSMLAALAAGAWYMAVAPGAPAAAVPDSRAGEMLPADPGALVAPGRVAPAPEASVVNPPSWIYLEARPGTTVFLFLPPAINR